MKFEAVHYYTLIHASVGTKQNSIIEKDKILIDFYYYIERANAFNFSWRCALFTFLERKRVYQHYCNRKKILEILDLCQRLDTIRQPEVCCLYACVRLRTIIKKGRMALTPQLKIYVNV